MHKERGEKFRGTPFEGRMLLQKLFDRHPAPAVLEKSFFLGRNPLSQHEGCKDSVKEDDGGPGTGGLPALPPEAILPQRLHIPFVMPEADTPVQSGSYRVVPDGGFAFRKQMFQRGRTPGEQEAGDLETGQFRKERKAPAIFLRQFPNESEEGERETAIGIPPINVMVVAVFLPIESPPFSEKLEEVGMRPEKRDTGSWSDAERKDKKFGKFIELFAA